ncbi:sensor histidine kinase [Phycicoccus flavus]|uniref:sensor histidine kinase n=1 Tax=Phycicoccus flavus TaxID=2502783 RepID=UPI000FEBB3E2|nr:HAMP domain-containing sensor histidine kinase [Phycicoccus flavus]NHA68611.1 HAMP domain-containing histidine kinase [Phycicoccus flavus]NHA68690.1 HAMP domain-containing histidine kinase [Phycicoccus flavus]
MARLRMWRTVRGRLALTAAAVNVVLVPLCGGLAIATLDRRIDADVAAVLGERLSSVETVVRVSGPRGVERVGSTAGVVPRTSIVTEIYTAEGERILSQPRAGARLLPAASIRALSGRTVQTSAVMSVAGEPTKVLAVSVVGPDDERFVVAVGGSLTGNRHVIRTVVLFLAGATVPSALVAGAVGWILAGVALRPVEELRRRADSVTVTGAGEGLPFPDTGDEVEQLGRTLDDLVRRLYAALADRHAEYAELAHDMRTPLTALRLELELVETADPQASKDLHTARCSVERLVDLVERHLLLAVGASGSSLLELVVLEPADLLRESRSAHERAAERQGTRLIVVQGDLDALSPFVGDRLRLMQVLGNLVDNSLRALGQGGSIELAATAVDAERLALTVADDGPGFTGGSEFDRDVVFTRFVRGEQGGKATSRRQSHGLGLAIAKAIVEAHDGEITASNRDNGGALVRVVLPVRGPKSVSPLHAADRSRADARDREGMPGLGGG